MNTLCNDELMRYARQLLMPTWGIEEQLALKNSTALVVGAGGLGSYLLPILVRAGIGKLVILDFDDIDISNLQRQALFFDQDIGKPKASVAANNLKTHNPWVEIFAINVKFDEDSKVFIDRHQPDLLIDCSDNFTTRHSINRLSVQHRLPLLSLSAIAHTGQIALYEPDGGCYACIFNHADGSQNCATSGVLTSSVAIIGAMGADIALQFLAKKHNPIAQKLILWQGNPFAVHKINYQRRHDCPICNQS